MNKKDLLNNNEGHRESTSFCFSFRFLLATLIFIGVASEYTQKIDIGIGIVCMVNHTAIRDYISSSSANDEVCFHQPENGVSHEIDGPFGWSKKEQGFILSSYFYGYILSQIPGGWLAHKIGGKRVFALSLLLGSVMTVLVPLASRWGYFALVVCRFITGIVHGSCKPALSSIFTKWAPPKEKSRIIGFANSGSSVGDIIALTSGGYLCIHGFGDGWSSIFYTFGLFGIVWFFVFMIFVSESPETHKCISSTEREYIQRSLANSYQSISDSNRKTPWSLIFRSRACQAIFVSHFACNWANYLFLTQLPSFMSDILKFDIKSNGLFSTLPYILNWILVCSSALAADVLIANDIIPTTSVRKLFNGTGLLIMSISTVCLSYVTCANPYIAVTLLTIGFGFYGLCMGGGFIVNINEVGGEYSSLVYGISNTFGTLPGIIAPYICGIITQNKRQDEWQVMFMISACIYLAGGLFYTLFASAEPEVWSENTAALNDTVEPNEKRT